MVVGLNFDESSTLTGKPRAFCMLCSRPTSSATGICSRQSCNKARYCAMNPDRVPKTTILHPKFEAHCVVCRKSVGWRRHRPEKPNKTGYYCDDHKGLAPHYKGAEQHPILGCEICGRMTRSRHGVCRRGTPACRALFTKRARGEHPEYAKRVRIRYILADPFRIPKRRVPSLHAVFCCVCGGPLARKAHYGRSYCDKHNQHRNGGGDLVRCEMCGELTRSLHGVCARHRTSCQREYQRRRVVAVRGPPKVTPRPYTCDVCGRATSSIYGVCWREDRSSACTKEYMRRCKRKDVRHATAV